MVKIGFICEGKTELILLLSASFKALLQSYDLDLVNVIDAAGSGNLLPHNISGYIESLEKGGAEIIFILTDLDEDTCITLTKERINARATDVVIVAARQIEAWFLANDIAMQALLNDDDFNHPDPEGEANPFEVINTLLRTKTGRGIGNHSAGKIKLIKRLLEHGFDLRTSAKHSNCASVKYFLDKLEQAGKRTK